MNDFNIFDIFLTISTFLSDVIKWCQSVLTTTILSIPGVGDITMFNLVTVSLPVVLVMFLIKKFVPLS